MELTQMKTSVDACLREVQYSNKRLSGVEKEAEVLNTTSVRNVNEYALEYKNEGAELTATRRQEVH